MELFAGEPQKITVASQPASGTVLISGELGERIAIVITALVIAFCCFWSTAKFDLAVHEFAWFQAAPDEPFYLWLAVDTPFSLDYRFASRILVTGLRAVGVTSFDSIALAYQVIFPPLAFLCAFIAARCLSTRTMTRLALAIFLCIAFDLLSGSSQVVANSPPALVLAGFIGKDWLFRPDLWSCFPVFRRPEPQVSFCFLFLYFSAVVHSVGTWRPRSYRLVCLATPLTAVIYITTGLIALLIFGLASITSALLYRRPVWTWFFPTLMIAVLAYALTFFAASSQAASAKMMFSTHLPTLRASVLWSALGVALCVFVAWRHNWRVHPRLCLAFIFFLVPILTLNQQILTGRAVMAQTWEVYGNYICIVMAAGLVGPCLSRKGWLMPSYAIWPPLIAWAFLLTILVRGELRNEGFWALYNVQSLAHARVYREAVSLTGTVDRVVLPHLWDESLFVTRVADAPPVLGSYNGRLTDALAPWASDEPLQDHLEQSRDAVEDGFETLARRGLSVESFRESLKQELATGNCWPTLMYFFSLQECSPILTDYRSGGWARLKTAVDPLADEYAAFLHNFRTTPAPFRVLAISYEPLPAQFRDSFVVNHFVAKTTVKLDDIEVTAYAYLQTSG
ncbi:MAG: hypothetical protein JO108_18260 [Acidobacteriaceae bacterium]|nr:hypothetical protein [Acidobacteriaceae bacterium]